MNRFRTRLLSSIASEHLSPHRLQGLRHASMAVATRRSWGNGPSAGVRLSRTVSTAAPARQTELVIFDKDGTLTDVDAAYGTWIEAVVLELVNQSGIAENGSMMLHGNLHSKLQPVWQAVGYDTNARSFTVDSVVVRGSNHDVRTVLSREMSAMAGEDVSPVVESVYNEIRPEVSAQTVETCGDVQACFASLQDSGVQLAVCTSDDREITKAQLGVVLGESANALAMACGDDADLKARKPDPEGILKLCRSLGVAPAKAVMVGDSVTDIQAGLAADCRCVFVLSGGYTEARFWEELPAVLPDSLKLDELQASGRVQVRPNIDGLLEALG